MTWISALEARELLGVTRARMQQLRNGDVRKFKKKDGTVSEYKREPVLIENIDYKYERAAILYNKDSILKLAENK